MHFLVLSDDSEWTLPLGLDGNEESDGERPGATLQAQSCWDPELFGSSPAGCLPLPLKGTCGPAAAWLREEVDCVLCHVQASKC